MSLVQIWFLAIGLGGIALIIMQNTLIVPIVFLGTTTSLPLGVWISIMLISGFASSAIINLLVATRSPNKKTKYRPSFQGKTTPNPNPNPKSPQKNQVNRTVIANQSTEKEEWDDWEEPPRPIEKEEWDDWEEEIRPPKKVPSSPIEPPKVNYEVEQDPKKIYREGSFYSYSYREPKNTGVGQSETIYDAEYRVIIPPLRDLSQINSEEDNINDKDQPTQD